MTHLQADWPLVVGKHLLVLSVLWIYVHGVIDKVALIGVVERLAVLLLLPIDSLVGVAPLVESLPVLLVLCIY